MQRDLEFVRDILLHIIGETPPIKMPLTIPGYDDPFHPTETKFLVELCIDAGFIKTTEQNGETHITNLTWEGYDMLDKLNDKFP